jgi:3-hydroxyisobutyrate dehydrogenase-like beta-hydroxyacid dehydrogenase
VQFARGVVGGRDMATSASFEVALLGCGKMGCGFVRRLRDEGVGVAVWNRTYSVAAALATEPGDAPCTAFTSIPEALSAVREGGLVILMLSTIAVVRETFGLDEGGATPEAAANKAALRGKVLCNLVSGNPDEGRTVRDATASTVAAYIDGAYSGSPAKARAGGGQCFVSSDADGGAIVREWDRVLSRLGTVTFSGPVGASRALDYAVVDLYFVNFLSFLSNAAMLEAEGVDIALYAREAGVRLQQVRHFRLASACKCSPRRHLPNAPQVPDFLLASAGRMSSRAEADYLRNPGATLRTWRNFWGSRLPYFAAHGLPAQLPQLACNLLDEAAGLPAEPLPSAVVGASPSSWPSAVAPEGPHSAADLTRLQEVVRYGTKRAREGAEIDLHEISMRSPLEGAELDLH